MFCWFSKLNNFPVERPISLSTSIFSSFICKSISFVFEEYTMISPLAPTTNLPSANTVKVLTKFLGACKLALILFSFILKTPLKFVSHLLLFLSFSLLLVDFVFVFFSNSFFDRLYFSFHLLILFLFLHLNNLYLLVIFD